MREAAGIGFLGEEPTLAASLKTNAHPLLIAFSRRICVINLSDYFGDFERRVVYPSIRNTLATTRGELFAVFVFTVCFIPCWIMLRNSPELTSLFNGKPKASGF